MQEDFLKFFTHARVMSLFFVSLHAHKNAHFLHEI